MPCRFSQPSKRRQAAEPSICSNHPSGPLARRLALGVFCHTPTRNGILYSYPLFLLTPLHTGAASLQTAAHNTNQPHAAQRPLSARLNRLGRRIDHCNMRHVVIAFFVVSVIVRAIANGFYLKHASTYLDELIYLQSAYDVAHGYGFGTIYRHASPYSAVSRVLYIALISLPCMIHNMHLRFFLIALINAILLDLGIFPIYLLAKQLIKSKRLQIVVLFLYVLMPDHCFGASFMADMALFPFALALVCASLFMVRWQELTRRQRITLVVSSAVCQVLAVLAKPSGIVFLTFLAIGLAMGFQHKNEGTSPAKHYRRANHRLMSDWHIAALLFAVCISIIIAYQTGLLESTGILQRIHRILRAETLFDPLFPLTFLYILLTVILALGVIPVITPPLTWNLFNRDEKRQLALFAIEFLFFVFLVGSYVHKPGASLSPIVNPPRALFRYMLFMYMPLLVFFVSAYEHLQLSGFPKPYRWFFIASYFFVIVCTCIYFYGNERLSVTDTSLLYVFDAFSQSNQRHVAEIALVCIFIVTACFVIKNQRWILAIFLVVWTVVQSYNNIASWRDYYHSYHIESDDSILQLRNYIYDHPDDTFLIIDYDMISPSIDPYAPTDVCRQYGDTYLDATNIYRINVTTFDQLYGDSNQPINLKQNPITVDALTDINYIILTHYLPIGSYIGCEPIIFGEDHWYTLYRCDDSAELPFFE
jgi:hypothetical protein